MSSSRESGVITAVGLRWYPVIFLALSVMDAMGLLSQFNPDVSPDQMMPDIEVGNK